jgi:hypothetical protein
MWPECRKEEGWSHPDMQRKKKMEGRTDGKKIQTLELEQYLPIRTTTYSEKLSFT